MKRSKGVVSELLPALVVPLVLVVFAAVFQNYQSQSQTSFEVTYTNESVVVAANEGNVAHPPIVSITSVQNTTDLFTVVTDYNDTEVDEDGAIQFGGTIITTPVLVTYVGHGGDGWDTFEKVRTGTWGGFKLASMLPYVIIALVVLSLLIGAFVFLGRT